MTGRVVRVAGHDTLPVADARVVLHRVTVNQSGPVDSLTSDRAGRFAFEAKVDSGAIYLVSARWQGVEYFAAPLALGLGAPANGLVLVVADTSSAAPITFASRHLIVSPLTPDGTRDVVDLVVLDNRGTATRVAADTLTPTWRMRLPHFAINIHGGNSTFSLESMRLLGDTVALYAAIPPGQHEIEIDYQIPPATRSFELPVDADVPVSNIISEDKSLRVIGSYTRSDTVITGKNFARWQGRLVAGAPVVLRFAAAPLPAWLPTAMAVAMALVLVGVTVRVMRR